MTTNTHPNTFLLRFLVIGAVIMGTVLLLLGSRGHLQASLIATGQGTTLHGAAPATDSASSSQAILTPAAAYQTAARAGGESAQAGILIIMGMLFVLLSLFLHAYMLALGERRVPVHAASKKTKKPLKIEYFWIEQKIRF
jgi:hypothetical protein